MYQRYSLLYHDYSPSLISVGSEVPLAMDPILWLLFSGFYAVLALASPTRLVTLNAGALVEGVLGNVTLSE